MTSWFFMFGGVVAWGLLAYALLILPTKWLKVEYVRHPLGLGVKLLQLSDMHVERLRITPERIARLIRKEKPDAIMLTGDFTQKEHYLNRLRPYLTTLRDSGLPVFAVLGNHDYQQRKVQRLVRLLQDYNIRVLRNESVSMNGYHIIGIDDFDSGKSNVKKSFAGISGALPRVVITHDPNIVLHLPEPYDYLMAGHLHGKQINVPFFFKLRPMGKLPAMGIYKGLHEGPWGTFYISKGLGQTGLNIRLFVRSEATVHEL